MALSSLLYSTECPKSLEPYVQHFIYKICLVCPPSIPGHVCRWMFMLFLNFCSMSYVMNWQFHGFVWFHTFWTFCIMFQLKNQFMCHLWTMWLKYMFSCRLCILWDFLSCVVTFYEHSSNCFSNCEVWLLFAEVSLQVLPVHWKS
jgi:hypothetical protein